ncbi:hypothetical protein [Virgibacillus dakarensis]|nr:hypothetical protein [Virgibacillus dakarensis]
MKHFLLTKKTYILVSIILTVFMAIITMAIPLLLVNIFNDSFDVN